MSLKIDTLLSLAADHPDRVLSHLSSTSETSSAEAASALAKSADSSGYTLLHAASSYGHVDLAEQLVRTYGVDVDVRDEDDETAVFVAESVAMVSCLVDTLGADLSVTNGDGLTAREKIEEEGEWPEVIAWLRQREGLPIEADKTTTTANDDGDGETGMPPLPDNMKINMSLEPDVEGDGQGDPELKRNLDAIVASGILDTPEGTDAVTQAILQAVERAAPGVMDDTDAAQSFTKKRAV